MRRSVAALTLAVASFLCALLAVLMSSTVAIAQETKVAKKDLPVPVQNAVDEQAKGAVVRGLTKEMEDGKTEYEAALRVNGHGKDISFDPAGNIVAVEEEVKLESLPPAARTAVQKVCRRRHAA